MSGVLSLPDSPRATRPRWSTAAVSETQQSTPCCTGTWAHTTSMWPPTSTSRRSKDRGRHLAWPHCAVHVCNVPGTQCSACVCLRVCFWTPPKCDARGLACRVPCPTRLLSHHPAPVRQAMESPLWRPPTMPGMQLQFPVRPVEGLGTSTGS